MQNRLVMPTFVGGLVMGVLSALPVINLANACCCLWVVAGGMVAAYLLQQNQTAPITPGDGALVGALAGLVGAVVSSVLSIPITLLMSPVQQAIMERLRETSGSVPPEVGQLFGSGAGAIAAVIGFLFMLVVGPAFSAIGGLLGAMMFRKPLPPPAPPAGPSGFSGPSGPGAPIDVPYSAG